MSRVAVVTGGAGAIGGAIAEALRASGHHVSSWTAPPIRPTATWLPPT